MAEQNYRVPRILTVAGSDSGGGAGIQADLKTITALGGFGMSALTALTAQNTVEVVDIFPVSLNFIKSQFCSAVDDIGVDVLKTGMLANRHVVELVADLIEHYAVERVVVDPVMISKGGSRLLNDGAEEPLKSRLLKLAEVVTPNLPEASNLSGIKVTNLAQMREAALIISALGPHWVVVKGGHMQNSPVNLGFDGRDYYEFPYERIKTHNTHGTGCTYASALATFRGFNYEVPEAVELAGEVVHYAIRHSLDIGNGNGPLDHSVISHRFNVSHQ